jgi:hypothetical protein
VKVNTTFIDSDIFAKISGRAFKLYAALRRFSDGNFKPCYPSQALLAQKTGMDVRTVQRGIAELVEAKVISVKKNRTGSNFYYFDMERTIEHTTNLVAPPAKSVASPPVTNKRIESPQKVAEKPLHVDKQSDKHTTDLSSKLELSFKQQTNNKKEVCLGMTELPIYTDFKRIKALSPEGVTPEAFAKIYNQALADFIHTYAYDRAQEAETALGSTKAVGYQAKAISFARLLIHGYGQESLNAPHAWALKQFRDNPQADKEHVQRFILEPSDLIHRRFYENIEIDLALQRKQAIEISKAQQLKAERQALADKAPPEIRKRAELKYNPADFEGRLASAYRERLIQEEIVAQMQLSEAC